MPEFELMRTECISFPRCGHHLLERLLRAYFEERFRYCDLYLEPEKSLECNERTNFQKNHDFALTTAVKTDLQYLVLVRDPREALISWFRLQTRNGELEYTHEAWKKFATDGWRYWAGFFDKWVIAPRPGRLVVDYRDLVTTPVASLSRIVEFLSHRPSCIDACRGIIMAERIEPSPPAELFAFGEHHGIEHFPAIGHGWPS
jgi:hypothetical protein